MREFLVRKTFTASTGRSFKAGKLAPADAFKGASEYERLQAEGVLESNPEQKLRLLAEKAAVEAAAKEKAPVEEQPSPRRRGAKE